MLWTPQLLPLEGLLRLGFEPTRFQTEPPACHRSSWQLPRPDSSAGDDELTNEVPLHQDPAVLLGARNLEVNLPVHIRKGLRKSLVRCRRSVLTGNESVHARHGERQMAALRGIQQALLDHLVAGNRQVRDSSLAHRRGQVGYRDRALAAQLPIALSSFRCAGVARSQRDRYRPASNSWLANCPPTLTSSRVKVLERAASQTCLPTSCKKYGYPPAIAGAAARASGSHVTP
jgi:hypothetical protein